MSFLGAQNSIALGVQGLIHIDTGVVGSADYLLAKSLRFRSSASAYLNRTLTTPTSSTIYTWSGWVKRGALSATGYLFGASTTTNFGFNSSNQLLLTLSGTAAVTTTAVYRDPAAWYHLVYVQNGATQTIYVNGVSAGTGTTANTVFNTAIAHQLAAANTTSYFDGEMAEVNFVDGQALAPTAFGATGANSQWLPKAYTGTYGTNGFYLPFNSVSTSSYAGSFNGSSQYLSVAKNAAFEPAASQAWTLEAWVYLTSAAHAQIYFYGSSTIVTGNDIGIYFVINSGTGYISGGFYNGPNQYAVNTSSAVPINNWTHVALVSTGSAITVYVNGISGGSVSTSLAPNAPALATARIGYNDTVDNRYFPGQISNVRFVKGTAVYTANFVPPTAPLTAVTNTSLLTLQSATVVDNSGNSLAITNVNTVVTSVQSPFLNPRVLVADSSGNANNWTPNNISLTAGSTYDSLTDVPTLTSETVANYAVLNPLMNRGGTLSGGNLNMLGASAEWGTRLSTIAVTSGKWYFEITPTNGFVQFGVTQNTTNAASGNSIGEDALGYAYYGNNGWKYNNNSGVAYGATVANNDVVGIAFDVTAGSLTFYKNNVSQGVAFSGLSAGTWFFGVSCYDTSTASINYGQQPFVYPTLPSGFLPLNTFNIAAGTVTTSGTFTGNLSTDGPFVFLNGTPTVMTINGNAVTFGTHADKLANGFKVRSSSASYNASGSNTYVATTVGAVFKYEDAQSNP